MPIIPADLKLYKSQSVTNTGVNGGRPSTVEIVSNTLNQGFDAITESQRSSGVTLYRKFFACNKNADNLPGYTPIVALKDISPSDARMVIIPGTLRNTVADLTGSERKYGVGRLSANAAADDLVITVAVELGVGADDIYQAGDLLRIYDGTQKQDVLIASRVWTGDSCEITLAEGLKFDYLASTPTTVSSCITQSDLKCEQSNWVKTSANGSYDDATYPLTLGNLATIEQTWVLTFTSSTAFRVIGDQKGLVGTGTIGSDFSPVNSDYALPFFTLLAAGWSGTWATNDTVVFQTHPAAIGFFAVYKVPAGAGAMNFDTVDILFKVD